MKILLRRIVLLVMCFVCWGNAGIVYAADRPNIRSVQARNAVGTWHQDSIGWWFEYSGGGYPTDTWEQINNYWYYFNSDGYMLVGWQQLSGEWYYLETSTTASIPQGAMVTGWKTINGVKYFFADDGRMIIEQPTATKNLTVKGYIDELFADQYGASYAGTLLGKIQTPYKYVWNFSFSTSYTEQDTLFPNVLCKNGVNSYCTEATDANCSNSVSKPYHHRNANKNLAYFKSTTPEYSADIKVALTMTPLCGWWDVHATGIYGVTLPNDSYTYITVLPSNSEIIRVRVIQHEIGHMFGLDDGVCSGDCVMNSGFNTIPLSANDIWCENCKEMFDRDAQ